VWEPVLRFLIWSFTRTRVTGQEYIPDSGPFIIVLNHVHWLDPALVVAAARKRYAVPIAKEETLSWPLVGFLLYHYPCIFIRRGEVDLKAMRQARAILAAGHGLLIAPEGTRSRVGRLKRGKPGTAYLAKGFDPIFVPAAVTGTIGFGDEFRRLRRKHTQVIFGPPFRVRWPEGKIRKDALQQITDEIMYRVAALLPPEMRGAYADLEHAATEWLITGD